jgi:hypothetical protein
MVMASLKDADAILYHIFRSAAANERELTAQEQTIVEGITRDKIALASLLNK